ncbi:MAG: cation transporter [Lachnospiraceae bacterium]|nr:cation transporter [Lachnospiraceae bacterium]
MALPTIISQLIVLIYNMADTFYLGRTNNPFMVAGVSLILPVFNICLSLAGLAGIGGGALISRLLGAGDAKEAEKVSAFSISLAVVTTAVFSVGMLLFMNPILRLLGASGNTLTYAAQYSFCVIVLGGIPTVLSNVMANLLRSVGESGKAGFGIAMGGVLNIILDPLFMFVLFPRGYEVLGVGVATLISNCCACAFFTITILREQADTVLRFRLSNGLPRTENVRSVFTVGIPSSIATLLFDIDYIVIDKLMSGYGDIALAAVGIVLKVERLPLNVGIGICQGMMPLVAYNYSSGDRKRMFRIIRFSLITGLIVGALSVAMYEVFAGGIIRLFIADPETVRLGTDFLQIRCLATPLMFMSFFTVYTFQGFGRGERSLFLGVMRWAVFNIPMLFILNHFIGMYGIVWSQVTADILTVALSAFVYFSYRRKLVDGGELR